MQCVVECDDEYVETRLGVRVADNDHGTFFAEAGISDSTISISFYNDIWEYMENDVFVPLKINFAKFHVHPDLVMTMLLYFKLKLCERGPANFVDAAAAKFIQDGFAEETHYFSALSSFHAWYVDSSRCVDRRAFIESEVISSYVHEGPHPASSILHSSISRLCNVVFQWISCDTTFDSLHVQKLATSVLDDERAFKNRLLRAIELSSIRGSSAGTRLGNILFPVWSIFATFPSTYVICFSALWKKKLGFSSAENLVFLSGLHVDIPRLEIAKSVARMPSCLDAHKFFCLDMMRQDISAESSVYAGKQMDQHNFKDVHKIFMNLTSRTCQWYKDGDMQSMFELDKRKLDELVTPVDMQTSSLEKRLDTSRAYVNQATQRLHECLFVVDLIESNFKALWTDVASTQVAAQKREIHECSLSVEKLLNSLEKETDASAVDLCAFVANVVSETEDLGRGPFSHKLIRLLRNSIYGHSYSLQCNLDTLLSDFDSKREMAGIHKDIIFLLETKTPVKAMVMSVFSSFFTAYAHALVISHTLDEEDERTAPILSSLEDLCKWHEKAAVKYNALRDRIIGEYWSVIVDMRSYRLNEKLPLDSVMDAKRAELFALYSVLERAMKKMDHVLAMSGIQGFLGSSEGDSDSGVSIPLDPSFASNTEQLLSYIQCIVSATDDIDDLLSTLRSLSAIMETVWAENNDEVPIVDRRVRILSGIILLMIQFVSSRRPCQMQDISQLKAAQKLREFYGDFYLFNDPYTGASI